MSDDSFPRQSARTRGFRLGAPRQVHVSADGSRISFVRSNGPTDAVNRLVVVDVLADQLTERVVADPVVLLTGDEHVPAAERARRERMRESTAGITSYSVDSDDRLAAFALSGGLYVADLTGNGSTRELPAATPVIDPRISPDGRWVSYVNERALHVIEIDSGEDRTMCAPDSDTVTYGLADFIAAEEHGRIRGQWWAPDSSAMLIERFDDALVAQWWIADPSSPGTAPSMHRYPAAGTANADVTLLLVTIDGEQSEVVWNHDEYPYLTSVSWTSNGPALITVLSRDQKRSQTIAVDHVAGDQSVVCEDVDEYWIDVIPGVPAWSTDGALVRVVADVETDTHRLAIGDNLVTPPGIHVLAVNGHDDAGVQVTVAPTPTVRVAAIVGGGDLTYPAGQGGISALVRGADIDVIASTSLDEVGTTWQVLRSGKPIGALTSYADSPTQLPKVSLMRAGERDIVTAVLFPTDHVTGSRALPVVVSPYGGPHHSEVLESGLAFASDQWIADQGFAVVVADGRGTPARGPAWEKAIYRDFTAPVLEDQITALQAAAEAFPGELDLARVGIIGWSFGGWLAAYAVLARPDIFHAAVAGAPVTDWRLYDTGYTERYLGHPDEEPAAYERNSVVALAPELTRPLMIIHGLADDNVVFANALELSGALLAAGKPHTVLPLSGVTHMASQETVAENLLRLQVQFLQRELS